MNILPRNNFSGRNNSAAVKIIFRSVPFALGILSLLATASVSEAAEKIFTPSLEVREEFNDNIYLTGNGRKDDFISTLVPGIEFNQNSERTGLKLLANVKWHTYVHAGIDSIDYQYQANLSRKLTLLDDLGLNAAYSRNSRLDNINPESGIPISSETAMSQYSISYGRKISEKSTASASYAYSETNYDNPTLISYKAHSAQISTGRDLSALLPLLRVNLTANLSRGIYGDTTNDNYSLQAGFSKGISEKTNLNISAGGRYTTSSTTVTNPFTGAKSDQNSDSSGFVGSAGLSYAGEKTFGSLNISQDISNASGQGTASEITSYSATAGLGITEKTSIQANVTYSNSHSVLTGYYSASNDARSVRAKTDLLYKISKYFDLNLQYSYYTIMYSNSSNIGQNSIVFKLVSRYPFIF